MSEVNRRKFVLKTELLEDRQLLAADLGIVETVEYSNDPFSPEAFPLEQVLERTKSHGFIEGELSVAFRFEDGATRLSQFSDSLWQDELSDIDYSTWEVGLDYERPDGTSVVIVDMEFSPEIPVQDMMRALADAPNVVWTSPSFYYDSAEDPREYTPNDFRYNDQYHHPLMQNDLAWDITTGDASIRIAVTDDGVDRTHVDLAPNIWSNTGENPGDGIDNDGNGYIDDVEGWDFIDQDNNPNPNGSDNHGTHVAGIAAGRIDNLDGIAGTAGTSTIMPVKFYNSGSAWTAPIIRESFEYAIDNGAQIVSTSYNINGWVGDPNFTAGIQYIHDSGALHFNSAGNGGELNPARQAFHQTLLVASTEASDQLSGFSNYGTGVDISAPGGSILSTIPVNNYDFFSGTSMAAPNAAGAAALIWSAHPTWTNYQVAAQLVGTGDNIDAQNPGRAGLLGGGRVNSFRALTELLSAPQITGLLGVPDNGAVTEDTSIDSFQVDFDRILDPTTANDPANFELSSAGFDGVFGTADDEIISTSLSSQYMLGSNQVNIDVAAGVLEVGLYRLRVVSDGVTDPFGQPLDGDGDGVAGGDYETFFTVVNPFKSAGPEPSLISKRVDSAATLTSSADIDAVRFFAEQGETLTAVARPTDPTAVLTLELSGVTGPISAASPGETLILPVTGLTADGDYEMLITSSTATNYSLEMYRNVEVSGLMESPSDISLDASRIELGSARYAALARADGVTGNPDFLQYNDASKFVDISATGTALGLSDDGEATITTTVGNLIMPAGSITVGNNGAIEAGAGNGIDYTNEALPTGEFSNAALLPFWDDIDDDAGNVYWQETTVDGRNALVVQWEGRPHYNNVGDATFQLQLFDSGPILARYAYKDVDFNNVSYDGGASATIGFQVDSDLYAEYSFNNAVLSDGDVIDISLGTPMTDTDVFTVDLSASVGQSVDLYLDGNASAFSGATVELLDPSDNVVATATPSGSFDQAIFGAPVSSPGIYSVRVTAGFPGEYYLVMTDDLAIDDEPNNALGAARDLGTNSGAFGTMSGGALAASRYSDASLFIDIAATGFPLGLSDDGEALITTSVGNDLLSAGSVTIGNNGVVASGNVDVAVGNEPLPSTDFDQALAVFWDDIDSDSGNVYWTEQSVDGINTLIVQWDNRPRFSNIGDATFQLQLFESGPVSARFAYKDVEFGDPGFDFGADATVGAQLSSTDGLTILHNTAGLADGDVIDFVTEEVDTYAFDLNANETVTWTTDTPFDHPTNEPANTLDVDLLMLDSAGNILAQDASGAGGNNAELTYTAASAGTYYVQVALNGGSGDYVLMRSGEVTTVDGDFDDDGDYDCDDINALTTAIASGSYDSAFDLTQDGVALDVDDLDAWLAEAGTANGLNSPYRYGDADLSGAVDVSDFNIWNTNKFTNNPQWCAGDFNADGVIDVSDFNILNGNIFTASLRDAGEDHGSGRTLDLAVPEVPAAAPQEPILVGRPSARGAARSLGIRHQAAERIFAQPHDAWAENEEFQG